MWVSPIMTRMAKQIKNISAYPEHSIAMMLKKIGKTEEVKRTLSEVEKELKTVPKSRKDESKTHIITDKEIFETKIKPQMIQELARCGVKDYKLQFHLEFPENPLGCDIDELGRLHGLVKVDQKMTNVLSLYLSYYQGLIYIALRNKCGTQEEFVQNLMEKFGTTYSTAQQYIVVTLLIKRYPRVLLVGLTHSQLRKHRTRLETFMGEHGDFEAPVKIILGKKTVDITPSTAEFAGIKVRASYDPDADLKPEMEGAVNDNTFDFIEHGDLAGMLGFSQP